MVNVPWNDRIFVERVDAAARALGKTRTATLEEVGISRARLGHQPRAGRVIDIFEKLMPALGWAPADVLRIISDAFGWSWPFDGATTLAPIDRELMAAAAKTASRGLRDDAELADLLPETILDVYDVLVERRSDGAVVDETMLTTLASMIRQRARR